jgi:hypothetical protein
MMKRSHHSAAGLSFYWLSLLFMSVCVVPGCTGMNNGLPSPFTNPANTRVPPPATGSFATPNPYSNTPGAVAPTTSATPTGVKTSQFNPVEQPANQVLATINQTQSQLQSATNQALDTVYRTADDLNSRMDSASARINRLGQGVVQAGAILSDAASASLSDTNHASLSDTNHASLSDTNHASLSDAPAAGASTASDPNAAWRRPTPR